MHRHTWYLPGRTLALVCLLTGFFVLFFELLDVLQPRAPIPKGSRSGVAQAAHFGDVSFTPLADNLDKPLAITHAGDGSGRLFIGLQEGQVVIYDGTRVLAEPFLDISGLVSCCGDQGLLGIAFHPDYKQNGFVYINYTDLAGTTIIARYSILDNHNRIDPNSAAHILAVPQPTAGHNGGHLAFGPDGLLYIGIGDGSLGGDPDNNAQDLGSMLGKILRIDVDSAFPYAIPGDNPFVNVLHARPEIWVSGLRNPWRFSFDRLTGDLFIADVGQASWEEINIQLAISPGGENYGWRRGEGRFCFNPAENCDDGTLIGPTLVYDHSLGCATTGGYQYRGQQMPSLDGTYIYSYFCSGQLWGATPLNDGSWSSADLLDTEFLISTLGEDEEGELYFAQYAEGTGAVYQLTQAKGQDESDESDESPGNPFGSWQKLPGNMLTLSSPQAVLFADDVWVVVRSVDNQIYFSIKNADAWSEWQAVPGNNLTPSAPAAAVWNGNLYLFVQGIDNQIYYIVGTPQGWTEWQAVPGDQLTSSAPTATVWNATLSLFVRGIDNRIYQIVSKGTDWSSWSAVPAYRRSRLSLIWWRVERVLPNASA